MSLLAIDGGKYRITGEIHMPMTNWSRYTATRIRPEQDTKE